MSNQDQDQTPTDAGDYEVPALHPDYNGCIIGSTVSNQNPRSVYSLQDMMAFEMMGNRLPEDEARQKIADVIRASIRQHGAEAPVFVLEKAINIQVPQAPKQLSEEQVQRAAVEASIITPSDTKVLTPFPGARVPNFKRK